jgi:hypothetical protein
MGVEIGCVAVFELELSSDGGGGAGGSMVGEAKGGEGDDP